MANGSIFQLVVSHSVQDKYTFHGVSQLENKLSTQNKQIKQIILSADKNQLKFPLNHDFIHGKFYFIIDKPIEKIIKKITLHINDSQIFNWSVQSLLCVKNIPILQKYANIQDTITSNKVYLPLPPLHLNKSLCSYCEITMDLVENRPHMYTFYTKMGSKLQHYPDDLIKMLAQTVGDDIECKYEINTNINHNLQVIYIPFLEPQTQTIDVNKECETLQCNLNFKHDSYMLCILPEFEDGYSIYTKDRPIDSLELKIDNIDRFSYKKGDYYLSRPRCVSENMLIYTIPFDTNLPKYTEDGQIIKPNFVERMNFNQINSNILNIKWKQNVRKPIKIHVVCWSNNILRTFDQLSSKAYV